MTFLASRLAAGVTMAPNRTALVADGNEGGRCRVQRESDGSPDSGIQRPVRDWVVGEVRVQHRELAGSPFINCAASAWTFGPTLSLSRRRQMGEGQTSSGWFRQPPACTSLLD